MPGVWHERAQRSSGDRGAATQTPCSLGLRHGSVPGRRGLRGSLAQVPRRSRLHQGTLPSVSDQKPPWPFVPLKSSRNLFSSTRANMVPIDHSVGSTPPEPIVQPEQSYRGNP